MEQETILVRLEDFNKLLEDSRFLAELEKECVADWEGYKRAKTNFAEAIANETVEELTKG